MLTSEEIMKIYEMVRHEEACINCAYENDDDKEEPCLSCLENVSGSSFKPDKTTTDKINKRLKELRMYLNKGNDGQIEAKTRHCPNCNKLINSITAELKAVELFCKLKNNKDSEEGVEIVAGSMFRDNMAEEGRFYCEHCGWSLTKNINEAKAFLLLPEEINEEDQTLITDLNKSAMET